MAESCSKDFSECDRKQHNDSSLASCYRFVFWGGSATAPSFPIKLGLDRSFETVDRIDSCTLVLWHTVDCFPSSAPLPSQFQNPPPDKCKPNLAPSFSYYTLQQRGATITLYLYTPSKTASPPPHPAAAAHRRPWARRRLPPPPPTPPPCCSSCCASGSSLAMTSSSTFCTESSRPSGVASSLTG